MRRVARIVLTFGVEIVFTDEQTCNTAFEQDMVPSSLLLLGHRKAEDMVLCILPTAFLTCLFICYSHNVQNVHKIKVGDKREVFIHSQHLHTTSKGILFF